MAFMSLGTFVFSLPTLLFDQLTQRMEWKHVQNPRVGARDATQFVGVGPETISLDGLAVAELQDVAGSFRQLEDMANQGGVWPLVDGVGNVWGSYVIRGIDKRSRAFVDDGRPLAIEFGIDLLRVDDPTA